jgi:general secretion pathway protein G
MTKQSGFSLIELTIYIVIVAILSVTMIPLVTSWIGRARISTTNENLKMLKTAIQQYSFDIGKYPTKLEDLINKPTEKEAAEKWHYPFLDKASVPLNTDGKICDPWKEPYQYRVNPKGSDRAFELYSNGDPDASEPFKIDVWKLSA